MKTNKGKTPFVLFLLINTLIIVGIKEYSAWPQVTYFIDLNITPLEALSQSQFHVYRYFAAYTGLLAESYFPNLGFSLFISLIIGINLYLLRSIYLHSLNKEPTLFFWIIILIVFLSMNGRGALGWLGWLICLNFYTLIIAKKPIKISTMNFTLIAISLLMASVSSGVFITTLIVYFTYFILLLKKNKNAIHKNKMQSLFFIIILICPILILIKISIQYANNAFIKALDYYENIYKILDHGFLFYFELKYFILMLPATLIILSLFYFNRKSFTIHYWILIIITFAMGLFGLTTLSLMTPLVLMQIDVSLRMFLGKATKKHHAKTRIKIANDTNSPQTV